MNSTARRYLLMIVPLAAALIATGCGAVKSTAGSSTNSGPIGSGTQQSLHDQLPASIKSSGVIKIATGASYPPDQYVDKDNKIVGWSVDILDEVGKRLEVKMDFSNIDFPGILPAIESHKFDIGSSSYAVTDDRRKAVDFVTYYQNGQYVAVAKGNPSKIDPKEVCGLKMAVTQGSLSSKTAAALSDQCVKAGKPQMAVSEFPNAAAVYLAISANRAEMTVVNASTLGNLPDAIEAIGDSFMPTTVGFIFAKDSNALRDTVHSAIQQMIADGTYTAILKKWGIAAGAITDSQVLT